MTVTVKDFMTRNPQTTTPESKTGEAVQIMGKKNIGSLLVVANGKIMGILTERDVLSRLVGVEGDPETTVVGDIMSGAVVQVRADMSLKQAAKEMTSKKSRLVVVGNGKPVGIVTATDIVQAIRKQGSVFDPSETVSRRIVTVPIGTKARDVVGVMIKRRVGSVIVTKESRPYGIFTERDLVKRVLVPKKGLETPIEELATRELIIARDETDGKGAAGIMASSHIKRLILMKGNEMAGVITARDIVEAYAAS